MEDGNQKDSLLSILHGSSTSVGELSSGKYLVSRASSKLVHSMNNSTLIYVLFLFVYLNN